MTIYEDYKGIEIATLLRAGYPLSDTSATFYVVAFVKLRGNLRTQTKADLLPNTVRKRRPSMRLVHLLSSQ